MRNHLMRPRVRLAIVLGVLATLLAGCGERDDRRYPDLPKSHPLNYQSIW